MRFFGLTCKGNSRPPEGLGKSSSQQECTYKGLEAGKSWACLIQQKGQCGWGVGKQEGRDPSGPKGPSLWARLHFTQYDKEAT